MTNSSGLPSWLCSMRRKDREIQDQERLWKILQEADVCRVAFCGEDWPYIVAMNFGCKKGKLYFHCASDGTKLDLLKANPNVCFEVETDVEIVPGENACNWSVQYQSVVGFGHISVVTDLEERRDGLEALLAQYAPGEGTQHSGLEMKLPSHLSLETVVLRIDVHSITGKASKHG